MPEKVHNIKPSEKFPLMDIIDSFNRTRKDIDHDWWKEEHPPDHWVIRSFDVPNGKDVVAHNIVTGEIWAEKVRDA